MTAQSGTSYPPEMLAHYYSRAALEQNSKRQPRMVVTLVIALVFSASFIGAVAGRLIGVASFATYFQAAVMVLVIVVSAFNKKLFGLGKFSQAQLIFTITMLCYVVIHSLFFYTSGSLVGGGRGPLVNKTLGTCLTFGAVLIGSRMLHYEEWVIALKVYATIEISLVLLSLFAGLNIEFNANNTGMRVIISAMILFILLDWTVLRWSILMSAFAVLMMLQCRTGIVSALGALSVLVLERFSRKKRVVFVMVIGTGLFLLFAFLPYIYGAFVDALTSVVGTDNFVSRKLLSDKTAGDIRYDMFDRADVWEHAWIHAKEKWLFGYGMGNEGLILGGIRSHNAYLSLIIEGGVVLLGFWALLYATFLERAFSKYKSLNKQGNDRLSRVLIIIVCYMLLSGILESSGFGSISSPNNLIFLFLSAYVLSNYEK